MRVNTPRPKPAVSAQPPESAKPRRAFAVPCRVDYNPERDAEERRERGHEGINRTTFV
ncbi:MAG TPA: hypothetical protein VGE53_01575 [Candidatus Paceibacterota bacterium]